MSHQPTSIDLVIIFGFTFVICYVFMLLARHYNLVAQPGGHRHHQKAVPVIGGLAMIVGLSLAILYSQQSDIYCGLLVCLLLMTLMGAFDDLCNLPSWLRFVVQAMVTYLMIKLTGVELLTLGQLVSKQDISLGLWSIPLTVFATIGVINAINMSDGMDGLAASMVCVVLVVLYLLGSADSTLIMITLAVVLAFLLLNARLWRTQAKLFMGDAGSMMLGLLLAFLLIKNSQQPNNIISPVSALWLLALPLFDAVSLLILRPLRGQSPFIADRNHYHHFALRAGLSVNQALLLLIVSQAGFASLGVAMMYHQVAQSMQFLLFLLCFALYFITLCLVTSKNQASQISK